MFDETVLLWREKVDAVCVGTFWDQLKPNNEFKQMWKIAHESFIWMDHIAVKKKVKKGNNNKKVVVRLPRTHKYGSGGKEIWHLVSHTNPKEGEWSQVTLDESRLSCYNWGDDGNTWYGKGSIYGTITSKTKAKEFISEYLAIVKTLSSRIYSFIKSGDNGGFDNKAVQKNDIRFLFVRYVEAAWGADVIEPAINAAFNTSMVVDPHFKLALLEPVEDEEDEDEINDEEEVNDGVDEVEIREQLGLDEC